MERPPRRSAQHEIFQHRKAWHQLHVLKNGADAEIEAFARRTNLDQLSVHANRARIRLLQAREDADEGRLSRAILAEQDMNLAGEDVERDVVVGDNAGKPLGDAA